MLHSSLRLTLQVGGVFYLVGGSSLAHLAARSVSTITTVCNIQIKDALDVVELCHGGVLVEGVGGDTTDPHSSLLNLLPVHCAVLVAAARTARFCMFHHKLDISHGEWSRGRCGG